MAGHKDNALNALMQVQKALEGPDPLEGLPRRQLAATVAYAVEEIEKVQELKRQRRVVGGETAAP